MRQHSFCNSGKHPSGAVEYQKFCFPAELGNILLLPLQNVAQGTLEATQCYLLSCRTHVFCSCTNLGVGNWDSATLLPLCLSLKPRRNAPSILRSLKLPKISVIILLNRVSLVYTLSCLNGKKPVRTERTGRKKFKG